jgi:hypothetical protein
MLHNAFLPRLLKKAQMQGGVTHPPDGYPGSSEAYAGYAAAKARTSGVPIQKMGHRRWAVFSSLL